jgi:hypothetical protein
VHCGSVPRRRWRIALAIGGILIKAMQRALMRQSIQETWYAEVR